MSGLHPRFENKSAESIAFDLYLRTGRRVSPEFITELLEQKFNPYHDPNDGRFTSGPGGGSMTPRARSPNAGGTSSQGILDRVIASARTRLNRPEEPPVPLEIVPPPAPSDPPWARTHPGQRLPVWHPRDRS